VGIAEANLQPVKERHRVQAARLWVDLLSLPSDHPIQASKARPTRRFSSPLWDLREAASWQDRAEMETIKPYALSPWRRRIQFEKFQEKAEFQEKFQATVKHKGIVILTVMAGRKDAQGYGIRFYVGDGLIFYNSQTMWKQKKGKPILWN
jgi:hypothetical protein